MPISQCTLQSLHATVATVEFCHLFSNHLLLYLFAHSTVLRFPYRNVPLIRSSYIRFNLIWLVFLCQEIHLVKIVRIIYFISPKFSRNQFLIISYRNSYLKLCACIPRIDFKTILMNQCSGFRFKTNHLRQEFITLINSAQACVRDSIIYSIGPIFFLFFSFFPSDQSSVILQITPEEFNGAAYPLINSPSFCDFDMYQSRALKFLFSTRNCTTVCPMEGIISSKQGRKLCVEYFYRKVILPIFKNFVFPHSQVK